MPSIDFPISVATFDQLERARCGKCRKKVLGNQESQIRNWQKFSSHTLRVVFPRVCGLSHLIHTKCYYNFLIGRSGSEGVSCLICDRRISITPDDAKSYLKNLIKKDKAFYAVVDMVEQAYDGVLDYSQLSDLHKRIDSLWEGYCQDDDVERISSMANAILGNSYILSFRRGSLKRAVSAYQHAIRCHSQTAVLTIGSTCRDLLKRGLEGSVQCLNDSFDRLEKMYSIFSYSDEVAKCLAQLYLARVKVTLDSVTHRSDRFIVLAKANNFIDFMGHHGGEFKKKLEEMCVAKCQFVVEMLKEGAGIYFDHQLSMVEAVCNNYPDNQAVADFALYLAGKHFDKTDRLFRSYSFINLSVLTDLFSKLEFSRKFGDREIQTKVQSFKLLYQFFMKGKFSAVLKQADTFRRTTGINPVSYQELSDWFPLIKEFGKDWHKEKLWRITGGKA